MIQSVKQGEHKFKPGFGIPIPDRNRQRLEGRVRFHPSCFYPQQYIDGKPYDGQNKLIGIQFSLTKKHQNDALISWAAKEGLIGLGPYWHIDGSNGIWWREPLITVVPMQWAYWKIEASIKKNTVDIFLREENSIVGWVRTRESMEVGCWSWKLPPWFGGQLPAGQDMSLELEIF